MRRAFSHFCRFTSLEELSSIGDAEKTQKFVETKSNLMNWIHDVEGVLLCEHAVINSIHVMENQLKRFKVRVDSHSHVSDTYSGVGRITYTLFADWLQELERSVVHHRPEIEFINSVAAEICHGNKEDRLQIEVRDLNTRWTDIPALLRERCTKLENGMVMVPVDAYGVIRGHCDFKMSFAYIRSVCAYRY